MGYHKSITSQRQGLLLDAIFGDDPDADAITDMDFAFSSRYKAVVDQSFGLLEAHRFLVSVFHVSLFNLIVQERLNKCDSSASRTLVQRFDASNGIIAVEDSFAIGIKSSLEANYNINYKK